ncbi:MAG: hypothetical protein ACYC1I_00640 [Acidimicrobiales bacterium]
MNDEQLNAIMQGIDPARDLSDETLDELLPLDLLLERLAAAVARETPDHRVPRARAWRRLPTMVAAGIAAVTLTVVAAASLFSSEPVVVHGTALAPTSHGLQTLEYGPVATEPGPALNSTVVVPTRSVRRGRFVDTVELDGGAFSISPAPASMRTPSNASAVANQVWATSQLQGYSKRWPAARSSSFGYGIVTITRNESGVEVITKQAAWVGLARETAAYYCPLESGSPSTKQLLKRAPSSGLAAVVVGQPSGSPALVYIARSVRCGRLYPASLTNAAEQFSLAWSMVGNVGMSEVALEVTPPPCGHIVGNALSVSTHAGALSRVTITEYGTAPDATLAYQSCPVPTPIREVVDLGGRTTTDTRFVHPKTGPMTVVARYAK